MKEKYEKFKEWRKNPRYNALFQLMCWFVFFGTLYLLACAGVFAPKYKSYNKNNDEIKKTLDHVENYSNMKNYEYQYNIKYDDTSVIISGIIYNEKNYFKIDNINYYDDGTLYLVDDENKQLISNPTIELPITLSEISQNSIAFWLENSEIKENIEYNDGSSVITYSYMPSSDYEIKIIAKESDFLINSLSIDLLSFVMTKDLQFNEFYVDIKYTNIDNISSYEKSYEEYQIVNYNENIDSTQEVTEEEVY